MPCGPRRWRPGDVLPVTSQVIFKGTTGNRKKWDWAPTAKGASPKQVGSRVGKAKAPSARSNDISGKPSEVKRAPYLNPDAFYRFIGPKNRGRALIDDELTTCLLDNGAQLNFITPACVQERGMDIMSLDYLAQEIGAPIPPIRGIGGIPVEPVGFVMMNVKVPCVQGYDEDQIAIVMDDPDMSGVPGYPGYSHHLPCYGSNQRK